MSRIECGNKVRVLRDIYRLPNDKPKPREHELYVEEGEIGDVVEILRPVNGPLSAKVRIDGAIKTLRLTSLEVI